ncbi:flagellar hook-length control protein FliK [Pyruvatibacter sp. HU-CL02332]|uniref:flagellar hook-length control protein FliK n=1 Tax=Pyruvatibacter sp. HU-CL02332 TaxID=3127650 RepID=UPI00310BD2EF
MTSTETFNAGQVRKAEAAAQVKNAEPRRAEDDSRFTEELRASRAEEKRQAEERVRERKSDEARLEETRKADAREAAARSEEARAEDARDEKAQEEKTREERASDQSDENDTAAAEDEATADNVEATKQQTAAVETVIGAEASDAQPVADATDTTQADDDVVTASVKDITTAEKAAATQQAAAASAAANKAEATTAGDKQNAPTAVSAASKNADSKTNQPTPDQQNASTAAKPAAAGNSAAAPTADSAAGKAQATIRDAAAAPVETEVTVASTSAQAAGKRGLGHATAESMQDAKAEAKPTAKTTSATQAPETAASTDKPTTMAQAAQRTSASEIALQAILAKPAGTPQDIRVAGLDGAASTPLQATDSAAPAPSVTVRAIVAASAQPGTPVQPQTPAREIAINMAKNLGNGTNRFEIRLDPAELGRIDVRMELGTDGRVQAHLTVDKPETLDMLQRDARSLEKALSDAGLDMENGTLSYSMRDDGDGSGFADNRDTAEGTSDKTPTEDELAADLAAVQHIYALKAGSGSGVDIRI